MRKLLITAILFSLVTGCAFQKDKDVKDNGITTKSVAPPSSAQKAFAAVKTSPFEEVESLLTSEPIAEIAILEQDGQTLLEVALLRGNPQIVELLLSKGASPFIKGSQTHKKPHQLIQQYSEQAGSLIGQRVMKEYQNLASYGTLEEAWTHFQKIGLNCTDLMNIHSFMSLFMNTFNDTVLGITQAYCKDQLDMQYYKNWLMGEIISLSRNAYGKDSYFKFLLSLKSAENMELDLPVDGGKLVGTPHAFLQLALLTKGLSDQHTQLTKAAELLNQKRPFLTFKPAENAPLISSTFITLDRLTEKEVEDLTNKYLMATGLAGTMKRPNCLMGCHYTSPIMEDSL
ncbi:hypothetical protein ACES2J_15575 [Bdellovibrio bacteriovorus]|uniref:hypothetical protein n=1 Tax=Bdellovibrio bacteriovorus TaxID=959 RepID=UPI0035A7327C